MKRKYQATRDLPPPLPTYMEKFLTDFDEFVYVGEYFVAASRVLLEPELIDPLELPQEFRYVSEGEWAYLCQREGLNN